MLADMRMDLGSCGELLSSLYSDSLFSAGSWE